MALKILTLDIETSPNLVHTWGLFDQNIAINQIVEPGGVICWAAKRYGEKEVFFDSIHRSSKKKMLEGIHKLLSEADVIVHFNGVSFDIPMLNSEFIQAGMTPPAPYKQVDLFRVAKRAFRFPSNKLQYISKVLGIGQKVQHEGHELWVKCLAGENAAWKRMEEYNKNDVVLTEKLYNKMQAWIPNHPNHGLYDESEKPVCVNCGSSRLQHRGMARTLSQQYPRFQCTDCGKWNRGTKPDLKPAVKKAMLRPDLG